MRRVSLSQPHADCVVIRVRADRAAVAVCLAALSVVGGLHFLMGAPLWLLALDAVVLPVIAVRLRRVAAPKEHSLVRAKGRLLLDGEPLELARVELRVHRWPWLNQPRGYSLSLWVMTATGPVDVPVGHFDSMVGATARSGLLEDFVQRARPAQQRAGVQLLQRGALLR